MRLLALIIAFTAAGMARAEGALPVLINRDDVQGRIFTSPATVTKKERSELGTFTTHDVEAFLSSDRKFDAGMYRAGPNRYTMNEPYGVNEFMYFLEGSVTLTSADGSVMHVRAGEAVILPKEWTGVWETEGYTKFYVIYSPDEPIK